MLKTTLCMAALCGAMAVVCLADEALLREAWTYKPGPKQEELAVARERFEMLVADWTEDPAAAEQPEPSADMLWLLSHRQAAYLVLDEQLGLDRTGAARTVLLRLAGRLGRRNLGPRLAPMLRTAQGNGERLEAVRCLSALQDGASLRALVFFLHSPPEDASEEVVVAAVRGLGHSRRPDVLPVIQQVRGLVRSPAGALEWAKAAYRCGDPASMDQIIAVLENERAPRELRKDAVAFLCENFGDHAVQPLARMATESDDDELWLAATWALINGTGYGRPPAAAPQPLPPHAEGDAAAAEPTGGTRPPEGAAQVPAQPLPGLPPELDKLSRDERRTLVQKLVDWWHTEGRARARNRAQLEQVS